MKLIKSKKYLNVYSYDTKGGKRWAIRFSYYDLTGTRREKQARGFKTELLAHKAELELETKYANDEIQQIMDSSMTVAQWVKVFTDMNKDNWRPNTRLAYDTCFNKYLIPALGKCKLSQLTRIKYKKAFIQPQLERLSPTTVYDRNMLVMALINSAVNNDVLQKNRLTGLRLTKTSRKKSFDEGELQRFNKALIKLNPPYRTLFTLLELTGMRKGEALALSWSDFDLENNTVTINKTKTAYGIGPTKTPSSNRTISISESMTKLLKHYHLIKREEYLHHKNSFANDQIVFTDEYGRSLSDGKVRNAFIQTLKVADIEPTKFVIHSLRHTHASFLLASGMNLVEVSHRLGHSSPSITLKIYAHEIHSSDRDLAEEMAKIANI